VGVLSGYGTQGTGAQANGSVTRQAGGLKNCEALPDMRAAGGRRQAELHDVADDALLTLRAQRQGRAPSGRCVPPKPVAPEIARSEAWALIERLKARERAA
jgi:hypothetical protein